MYRVSPLPLTFTFNCVDGDAVDLVLLLLLILSMVLMLMLMILLVMFLMILLLCCWHRWCWWLWWDLFSILSPFPGQRGCQRWMNRNLWFWNQERKTYSKYHSRTRNSEVTNEKHKQCSATRYFLCPEWCASSTDNNNINSAWYSLDRKISPSTLWKYSRINFE